MYFILSWYVTEDLVEDIEDALKNCSLDEEVLSLTSL